MISAKNKHIPQNGLQIEPLVQRIITSLEGLRFGSLEIIVHEGRVVQIERKEKLRFDQEAPGRNR
jgi:hypothetical protein